MTANILLIGDSCLDEYYIGSCDRLSPEAPVPVMKIVNYYTAMGMAANVHNNLLSLGLTVTFISNTDIIKKTRYIDQRSGQHLLRVDKETKIQSWDGIINKPFTDFDAIVISDYNKGFVTYEHVKKLRYSYTGPIFIDTKKPDLAQFHGCYVKINEHEYQARRSDNDKMIVTLGSQGAMYIEDNHEQKFPGNIAEVTDVCGCGDTFLAALVYEYLMTDSVPDAIDFANKAASITVQHRGNYCPTLKELGIWVDDDDQVEEGEDGH